MCGFAGVVVWDERYRVSPETLRRMSAAVAHRGPDGEGIHLSRAHLPITPDAPQVALAFRRLAILDPDERSMQPFTDGRRWLVFNGEIYNFRELRAELSTLRPDYQWRTTGDTEVLLAAYAEWRERCVERLNGMFAFAVWDEVDKTLFLARDRMGQKPLYVAYADGVTGGIGSFGVPQNTDFPRDRGLARPVAAVAFASDSRSFNGLDWVNREVNPTELVEYLRWGHIPTTASIFWGIAQVRPGSTWAVSHQRSARRDYFDAFRGCPEGEPRTGTVTDPVATTRSLVRTAVERQLVSDVPLGCFLSGGIDSSVIAAVMARSGHRVETFSVGFDDPRYDESAHAAEVARHLGTVHHAFTVRPDELFDLSAVVAAFGEPFGDSSAVPTAALSAHTRPFVTVALSGDGGDELFGGYDRYRALRLASRVRLATTPLAWIAADPALRRMPTGHPKSRVARLTRFVRSLSQPAGPRYAGYLRLMDDSIVRQLLSSPAALMPDVVAGDFAGRDRGQIETAMASDRFRYLPGDLLTKVDRCSMLHGLEVRSPFMDPDVVTFAAGLTTDQLLRGGPKRMLREAFADDLPAWVFRRRKMGFAVPVGDWFRGPLRPMLRDTLFAAHAFGRAHFDMAVVQRLVEEHESKRVDHGQRLYALLMLELWWDTVRQGP